MSFKKSEKFLKKDEERRLSYKKFHKREVW